MENNVWEKFQFNEKKQTSALDLLKKFSEGLVIQTSGELRLDTETADAHMDNGQKIVMCAVHKLFVVAPKLGEFRRKILTVVEYSDSGRFPVDIVNHFSNEAKEPEVTEADFNAKIECILSSPSVKKSIEDLYQLSKQHNK